MALTLNDPVKKKVKFYNNSCVYNNKPPFPLIIRNESNQLFTEDVWLVSTGRFNGLSVVVDDPEEMMDLHTMGFFGKGCLSKRVPHFASVGKGPPILRERVWKRRKEWMANLDGISKESEVQESSPCLESDHKKKMSVDGDRHRASVVAINKENISLSNEILVIADSDTEEDFMNRLNPRIEIEDEQNVFESLHLSLEEAFFLCYGIGCLRVIDLLGNMLPIATLWNYFRQTDSNFVENYVAYHYFRAKGWVVKSGIQFGGQFILYKKGPVFYHSSYVVVVEVYNADGKRANNNLSLFKLTNLNRLAESSFKEVLICEVHRPNMAETDVRHPDILPKYTVRENLMRRWLPSQERESFNDSKY